MQKLTKIVATIGPASESEEVLKEMIEAGMNVARFNTKHSDPAWHNDRIQRVRKVAAEMGRPLAILLDLQGPEIRINLPEHKAFELAKGETAFLTADEHPTKPKTIMVPPEVIVSLKEGSRISVGDGACEFVVNERHENELIVEALFACTVNSRKTMNTPGIVLDMPSLTERDLAYMDGIAPELVDYIGLSFVRTVEDIHLLREEMLKRNYKANVVAKIENQQALDNLDSLIEEAEAVMVARGDLGVETPYQELIFWQKQIITKSRLKAKPVITATEMLKSMVNNPFPTRAEVSDVAHSIYDGTDAIMLSDETTIGQYPVKAITVQATIANFNEPHVETTLPVNHAATISDSITFSAIQLLRESSVPIHYLVCLSESGHTARTLARFHPNLPLHVITGNDYTYKQMALVFGAIPHMVELATGTPLTIELLSAIIKKELAIKTGETALIIHGPEWQVPDHTNNVSLVTLK